MNLANAASKRRQFERRSRLSNKLPHRRESHQQGLDSNPSKLHPSEQEDAEDVDPVWTLEDECCQLGAVQRKAMVNPLTAFDTIHPVMLSEVFGLKLPRMNHDPEGESIQNQLLLEGDFNGHGDFQVFGHQQAAVTRDVGTTIFAAHYQWSSKDAEALARQSAEYTTGVTGRPFPKGP